MNNKRNEQEIDLKEIFFLLLANIRFIIILTVLGVVLFFCYAKFMLPVKYTSSLSIFVKNSSDSSNQSTTASDLTAARSLATTYIVILDDDVVYEKVSDQLLYLYHSDQMKRFFTVKKDANGKEYIPPSQIRSLVKASAINNTEVIQLTAVTEDPQLSADICNIIADYAKELLVQVTKAGSVEAIGSAKAPTAPSGPSTKRYGMIGGLIGALIGIAVIVMKKLFNNRINTVDDIRNRFDIAVLGEIPDLIPNGKEGGRHEY